MRWGLCFIASLCLSWAIHADPPTPPGQPTNGPGGSDYAYERMRTRAYGQGAEAYWIFEPANAANAIAEALPVVLFVHGLNAPHYGIYGLWIEHLVRHGSIVVYPRYQQGSITNPHTFTDVTAKAMCEALARMDGTLHAKADTTRFAIVGHSLGGTIGLNLAARPKHFGLPTPRAVMPVLPGDVESERGIGVFFPRVAEDYSTVPEGTLMLVIASTNDAVVGNRFAKRLMRQTTSIRQADKSMLLISDDRHGSPALSADHFTPLSYITRSGRRHVDAYDFALWRWFDALCDAAFDDGKHRAIALGGADAQRAMGQWSDGQPILQPTVYTPEDPR